MILQNHIAINKLFIVRATWWVWVMITKPLSASPCADQLPGSSLAAGVHQCSIPQAPHLSFVYNLSMYQWYTFENKCLKNKGSENKCLKYNIFFKKKKVKRTDLSRRLASASCSFKCAYLLCSNWKEKIELLVLTICISSI